MTDKQILRNFVRGGYLEPADGGYADLVDPSTGEVFAAAPVSGPADVDQAMVAAATAFEGWRDTTPSERQRALLKIADAVEARAEELVDAECRNTGKPRELTATEEIRRWWTRLRFFAGAARMLEGRSAGEYLAGHTSYVRREPIGVCAQVTPWNYPMMMAVWKFAPALAAGNTVVLKPSDTTPGEHPAAGRDRRRVPPARACSTWSAATATPAVAWWRTRPRNWSPSPAPPGPGREVAAAAAADLKRTHLELGGKAPVIVFDDADIAAAAEAIAVAGYFNAGQDCTAATRVLVGPGVHDDFVAALTEQARATRTGGPSDADVLYGPLNNANQLKRVSGFVERLPDHAAVQVGGGRVGDRGFFYAPTVVDGLRQDDEIIQDEVFGPVITVQRFTDEDRGGALGQRCPVRTGVLGVDPRPRHGRCGSRADSTSAASGSTPTSRWWPRCRTAASSIPATARTCPCTVWRTTPGSSTSCTTSRRERHDDGV